MAVAIRIAAAIAGKTILNSLITGMIFEKNSTFRLRGYSESFVNNDNLNKTCAVDN